MQLGAAIGIFITVALLLMILFCVVTRYFNFKLRKALEEQAEVYSLIDGLEGDREDIHEGEYEDFVIKRIADRKQKELEKDKNYKLMIQMTDMNEPLQENVANIYGISRLKRRLDLDISNQNKESGRSLVSTKSFKPQALASLRSPSEGSKRSPLFTSTSAQLNKAKITTHKTVNKIVCYNDDGITIVEANIEKLWREKQGGPIKQLKKAETTIVNKYDSNFKKMLDAYGFELELYEAYKFNVTYDIVNMKAGEQYLTKSLKKSEEKEFMQFPSFFICKENMEDGLFDQDSKAEILQAAL